MLEAIAHRGPDDRRVRVDGPIALGHARLSIIDPEGGAQPLANEDERIWIVCNGEIYNFRELRTELEAKGHRFRSHSDTEVIVHLYEEVGDACLERLNGIFALALWDGRSQRLLVARDPFGVKPVYYTESAGKLVFASELKALLCDSELDRQVDLVALDWFLTYRFVPSPRTMLRSVRKLAPGHLLVADQTGATVRRYTTTQPLEALRIEEREAVELVRSGFEAAVARQMMSDVPIGAFLSGGIDSGSIVAVMARNSQRVRTYSVGFCGPDANDELADARETARLFGTDHHELAISAQAYADALPTAIWHLDEPISTSSALPLLFLAQLAGRDVKVALAGQGADEPFAGYTRYIGERYRGLWTVLPGLARSVAQNAVDWMPRTEALKRGVRALGFDDVAERFRQIYAVFPDSLKDRLLRPDVRNQIVESSISPLQTLLAGLEGLPALARLQHVDVRLSLADDLLTYGDRMTMASSVEMRVPFLDVEFMQLVERIPANLKLKGLTGKFVWKQAARRWLPASMLRRPKRGFETPIDGWFRGPLSPFVKATLLDPGAAAKEYFETAVVEGLIRDHQLGRRDYRRQLFSLLSFELWHRQFVAAR
jgi:asparagine synthase (glutamine-hydrolysing)